MRTEGADQALVDRIRAGDSTAMADLAARYGSQINQLALRYVKNREDAEEVAQDVLMKVYRKIDAFRGDAALSSWIYRITFNTAMSRLRHARARRDRAIAASQPEGKTTTATAAGEPADWSDLADEVLLRQQMKRQLVEALRTLPEIYRVPVILRDVQGLSTEEAAAVLRVKPQTVKSRLHRGRLALREKLAQFASGLSLHRGGPAIDPLAC
jgi:RNA polymerase sigma-70 factor, ECF subfamily